MIVHKLLSGSLVILISLNSIYGSPSPPIIQQTQQHNSEDYTNAGLRTAFKVYNECSAVEGGFVPCLKKKAISFIDRIELIDTINIGDGIKVVRIPNVPTPISRALNENEIDSQLPRNIEDRDTQLTTMLFERIGKFFNGHTLQINFPQFDTEEIGRQLSTGRGKMKKMMGMMMMGMAMKMMGMIPVAMAGLYMLAGKALIVSKIALLLAGIMGLKKLMSGRGGGGGGGGGAAWPSGGSSGGWSSGGGGGGGGGWDRRSIDNAQELAYRGYVQQMEQIQKQTKNVGTRRKNANSNNSANTLSYLSHEDLNNFGDITKATKGKNQILNENATYSIQNSRKDTKSEKRNFLSSLDDFSPYTGLNFNGKNNRTETIN
ncbi:uncharacterized protein LOC129613127 [Condylostylus longicornis]|uniref:uncharacterized protein LOC129613127 n=1 Tax=Condylostylus longicornis TaxID=2530218 RepID=UPI00244E5755|nr:uncharacterized protein LOC129613127 [Condylostylus longicornis]